MVAAHWCRPSHVETSPRKVRHEIGCTSPAGTLPRVTTPLGGSEKGSRTPRRGVDEPRTFVSPVYGRGGRPLPTLARPPRGRTSRSGRSRRIWLGIGGLITLWLLFLVVVAVLAYGRIDRVEATPGGDRPPDGPGTNYLLVGSDSREELTPEQVAEFGTGTVEGKRTDTILLLHVPGGNGAPPTLLSIPRDSYVPIPGHNRNKINTAYSRGGQKLLAETIEQVSGVHVDGYVEIGFDGFAGIVNAVGGVDICLDEPMQDPMANLDLAAGCQTLNGAQSLGYVRTRATPRGDLDRVARQQQFLGRLAGEVVSPWTLINPVRYTRTTMSMSDALTVGNDMGPVDLARFALGMRRATGPDGRTLTVPVEGTPTISGVGSVVDWDNDAAVALFEAIQNDTLLPDPR
jgi:LCP family protein required for cell wall assembly